MKSLSSNRKYEKGQGLVEYALILVLVGIVVIGALTVLGPKVGQVFSDINNSIAGQGGGSNTVVVAPTVNPVTCTAAKSAFYAARDASNACVKADCSAELEADEAARQTMISACR